jgi:hypothetical protein
MVGDRDQVYNNGNVQSLRQPDPEADFMEETAAEIAEPIRGTNRDENETDQRSREEEENNGRGIGWLALAFSIVSLFIMPIILGAAGIILGFVARRRGAQTLGTWSIGIGIVSIIIAMFVLPFYR